MEIHQLPGVAYQGPPQDMVEMTFTRFLTPQEVTLLETVCTWRVLETIEDSVRRIVRMGPHYQSHCLPPLYPLEANASNCMCLPFQIRPCETNAAAMYLVNSFQYQDEMIAEAYEGAGWAFPVKTYYDTLLTRVHFQGFEILWHGHFPPNAPHHVELEQSLSLIGYLPPMLSRTDVAGHHTDKCHGPRTGTRLSTVTSAIFLDTPTTLLSRLKDIYSTSSKPLDLKMSLMPYLKQLEEELELEDVKRLQKKVKQSEDFKNSLEYLSSSLVPSSWPMSGFEPYHNNFSYPMPYSNFLELNSTSFTMYVPYASCNDISICVQKGLIINTEIDNPHYFGETCFNLFESHAYLLIRSHVLRPITQKKYSKKERSDYWLSMNGIGKKKKFTRWPGATIPLVVTCKGLIYPVKYLRSLRRSELLSDSPMICKVQDRVR